jgi:hypothetical protein
MILLVRYLYDITLISSVSTAIGFGDSIEWRSIKSDLDHLVVPLNLVFKLRRSGAGKPRA